METLLAGVKLAQEDHACANLPMSWWETNASWLDVPVTGIANPVKHSVLKSLVGSAIVLAHQDTRHHLKESALMSTNAPMDLDHLVPEVPNVSTKRGHSPALALVELLVMPTMVSVKTCDCPAPLMANVGKMKNACLLVNVFAWHPSSPMFKTETDVEVPVTGSDVASMLNVHLPTHLNVCASLALQATL